MNYYIIGYHRQTGKTVYRSALNEDHLELIATMEHLHNEFDYLFLLKIF